ncbi:MAG: outer membrane protein assembly factor BamD [Polyangiaceae bacterium]|jgi:outer membrane protein assembly factor BamD
MGPRLFALSLLAVIPVALAACEPEPPKTAFGYTENAKRAYDVALALFDSHQWLDAQSAMREVKRKYSYSKYARLAELRIADADYAQDKFAEALHEYKDFVHAHRGDEEDVAYARSRIAEATYAQIPESFLMPASEERDQGSVVDAYKELRSFLADYQTAKEAPRLRELLSQVVGRLIRHELYVARFYASKENYNAAVARIEYALHNYGDSAPGGGGGVGGGLEDRSLEADALLLLGETYLRMHRWSDARQAFEAILRKHPRTLIAVQARNYIEHMKERGA